MMGRKHDTYFKCVPEVGFSHVFGSLDASGLGGKLADSVWQASCLSDSCLAS